MSESPQARAYYMSDRAYNSLTSLAQQAGYVPYGSNRVKGLSEFLNILAAAVFEDTRPEPILQRHKEEEAHSRAPTWLYTRIRRGRLLKLTDDAIARYFLVAFQVGIVRTEPFIIGGPSRLTPFPAVSLVLEAIGLKWITPDAIMHK